MQETAIKKTIRPLIKWTGGKYEEYAKFAAYIPPFAQYFEPFFGGGGVFFALQPAGPSYVNDRSQDLITFYRALGDPVFETEMYALVSSWEAMGVLCRDFDGAIMRDFTLYLGGKTDLSVLSAHIDLYFAKAETVALVEEMAILPCINPPELIRYLRESAKDKFKRIKRIADREPRGLDKGVLSDHIETALRSGFYLYMRHVMNQAECSGLQTPTKTAIWYFVREMCYASMFRFNAKGEFNIPYGGIAYNKKKLRTKVCALFSSPVQHLFRNCTLYNLDFEVFLDKVRPREGDFIFVDPPYDSEFSEYDQNSFTRQDQIRLRDCLARQTAKWMMVIKETPYIRSLYEEIGAHFINFDKTYLYNVRGRNKRDTTHLIITNYVPSAI